MCPAICGDGGPMSLLHPFDFPGQLKYWLRVRGDAPKLYCFGQQVLLCSTRSQPQDCRSLLNLLLLDATGLPAAFPSSRQGMLVTYSGLGTTVPVRLLQEALDIFVFKQISQFVYFGKWVKTLCLPDTTFAQRLEGNSREALEASRCSGTLSSTRFSLNSSPYSGRSCDKFPCTSTSSSFLSGFSVSAGPCDEFPRTS